MWPDRDSSPATGQDPGEQPIDFGPYQILARLAAGGMANVLMAREPRAAGARLVTIKTVLPELAGRTDVAAMFLDEIAVAERLRHPNCVETYASGEVRSTPFMAMEFVLGDTVATLVKQARAAGGLLPARVVAWIMACVAEGLHYVHELKSESGDALGFIHRDVSPQNLMVTYDGHVKILDFGVAAAKKKRQATITGIIKGKLRYMSLEQLTGRTIDRRADIYALGVVLFEALTAKRLIHADTQEAIIETLTSQPLPSLQDLRPDLPESLVWIASRALALHCQDRYSTAAEIAEELRAFVRAESGDDPSAELSSYVRSLLGPKIEQRRALSERLIAGDLDLPRVRATFSARRAFGVDIHPAASGLVLDLADRSSSDDLSPASVQIAFESPVEWASNDDVSMGSLEIAIDVTPAPPKGTLERVLPELGLLQDRGALDNLRLLELANLWLQPQASPLGAAAVSSRAEGGSSAPSEDVTQFDPNPDSASGATGATAAVASRGRAVPLLIGMCLGLLLGGPMGGLITWLLTRN